MLMAVGIVLRMGSANERRRYIVTSSLIRWAHTQHDPYDCDTMGSNVQVKKS